MADAAGVSRVQAVEQEESRVTVLRSTLNRTLDDLEDDSIYHVYPTFGRQHITDKRDQCWCTPKVELCEGGAIIQHKAEQ